jgi:peptidoglycan/xylan/chitin deacetylase (PgdA/CDA1 family)
MVSKLLFMSAAQRRLFQDGVPVLMYHKIDCVPRDARDPFLYVSPSRFGEQLGLLSSHGYTGATLDTVPAVKDNRARQVVITFDDGAASVFTNALETLARHGFRAIQFIVAGLIGKRNDWDIAKGEAPDLMMDESQIREWLAAGHEIGSHTSTHPNLKRLSLPRAREEIFESKKKLEDRFGIQVRHFCYPSGKWNEPVSDLVREAGYQSACTVEFGVNTEATPRFALRRVTPLSGVEFLKKVRHRIVRRLAG